MQILPFCFCSLLSDGARRVEMCTQPLLLGLGGIQEGTNFIAPSYWRRQRGRNLKMGFSQGRAMGVQAREETDQCLEEDGP